MKQLAVIATVLLASSGIASAQDVNAGAVTFKKCAPCHDVGPTAKNKVGPLLNGLDGRKSGSVAGYSYSDANKNSGIVWNQANFLEYIKDPRSKVPNTKMVFAGIKDASEAQNLWAFLKQYDAEGKVK